MRYTEAVGIRLGELLKDIRLTQKDFSLRSGVSRITINRTINGKIDTVTFETLVEYCKALNITFAEFFHSDLFKIDFERERKKKGRWM